MDKNKKTFNLKTYQEIDTDGHIDRRLQEEDHADIPNETNQGQLEEYRSVEETVTTEKQLEQKRLGSADKVTEKNLDETTGWVKHRNPEAYEGDINKVEEQRLNGEKSPVQEEEPYVDATKNPGFKWWDKAKSDDGLKVAQDNKIQKTAQGYQRLLDIDDLDKAEDTEDTEELYLGDKARWEDVEKDVGAGVPDEPMTSPDIEKEWNITEEPPELEMTGKVNFNEAQDLTYKDVSGTQMIQGSLDIIGSYAVNPEKVKLDAVDYINDFVIPRGAKNHGFNSNDYEITEEHLSIKGDRVEFTSGPKIKDRSVAPKIHENVDLTNYIANDLSEIKVADFAINDIGEVKVADVLKKK